MKPILKELIEENKIELIRSYIYNEYIGYEVRILAHFMTTVCNACDLYTVNYCWKMIEDDKNNMTKCKSGIADTARIRYSYERISPENASLFLSRYLLKTLSQTL